MKPNDEILQRLSKLEIFSDFPANSPENIARLEKVCVALGQKDFKKDDVIILEGDEGDTLYILYDGTVQVRRKTPSKEDFAVVNLTKEQNVFFGEIALIDHDKRSASIVALTDCKTLTLTDKDFIQLCENDPYFGYKVLFKIAKRMSGTIRKSTSDTLAIYQALIDEVENRI